MNKDSITEHKRILRIMVKQAEEQMGINAAAPYALKLVEALTILERQARDA